jgi:hypothetical protein
MNEYVNDEHHQRVARAWPLEGVRITTAA